MLGARLAELSSIDFVLLLFVSSSCELALRQLFKIQCIDEAFVCSIESWAPSERRRLTSVGAVLINPSDLERCFVLSLLLLLMLKLDTIVNSCEKSGNNKLAI